MNSNLSIFSPSLFAPPARPPSTSLANACDLLSASIICILSLLIPPGALRQSSVIPTFIFLFYHVRQTSLPTGNSDSYMAYIHLTWALIRWIDYTVLRVPETSFLRTSEPTGTPIETPSDVQSYPFRRKLWWSASLMSNFRLIGWSQRVKNIAFVPASTTRSQSCVCHALLVLQYNIILDARNYLITHTSLLTSQTVHTFFSLPLHRQLIYVWAGILNSAANIGLGYHLPALLAIATHLSPPQSWPSVLGPWSSAHTVRNAWGKLWHQYLRRFFEVANTLLLTTLRIKRGTTVSQYTQIYFAFLCSALFHHVGALNIPYLESVRYQFLFFLLQPVCITVEDIAVAVGNRLGLKDTWCTRAVGYLWTFTAISWTGRYMAVWFFESGAGLTPNPILFRFWERVPPVLGIAVALGVAQLARRSSSACERWTS